MPVAEFLSRHPRAWRAATRHPVLDAADVGTALTALRTTGRTYLDGVPAPDADAVFVEVAAAEAASWDMAVAA